MLTQKQSSVLVCVTGQYNCIHLIKSGYEIAVKKGYDLHVLCVRKPVKNIAYLSDEIEFLYQASKEMGASMTIFFNDNAPKTTVDYAKKVNAKNIVTGIPGNNSSGFVKKLSAINPKLQITMVTKTNKCLPYNKAEIIA